MSASPTLDGPLKPGATIGILGGGQLGRMLALAAARLGLAADVLLKKHPRLIVCDLSGYGDTGPYAEKKAYDLLVQSEAGVLSVTGTPA